MKCLEVLITSMGTYAPIQKFQDEHFMPQTSACICRPAAQPRSARRDARPLGGATTETEFAKRSLQLAVPEAQNVRHRRTGAN